MVAASWGWSSGRTTRALSLNRKSLHLPRRASRATGWYSIQHYLYVPVDPRHTNEGSYKGQVSQAWRVANVLATGHVARDEVSPMPLRREERVPYARAVWSEFVKLRGEGHPNPTAKEYYILTSWMEPQYDAEGRMIRDTIPLALILRAFGEFNGKPRLLTAMEVPVSKAYAYYRQAMAL